MEQKEKVALVIFFTLFILIIIAGAFFLFEQKEFTPPAVPAEEQAAEISTPPTYGAPTPSPETPTLTPEKIEIISRLETHVVTIENKSFSPANLTIKLHDQVEWRNNDGETFQIKGENWGDVPIEPGESFTQAFETAGTFTYSCTLHPELTGTIIVQ